MLHRVVALALLASACVAAEAEEFDPNFSAAASIMGPNVGVAITWHPGTVDSITFAATEGAAVVASMQLVPPFTEPQVDTLLLGARPAPGGTKVWVITAAYWWDNRGTSTPGLVTIGSISYTEPQPAGVPPTFDSLPPADTGGGVALTVLEMEVWPSAVTMAPGDTVQFCTLARLSNDSTLWVALDGIDSLGVVYPAPAECNAVAGGRNPAPVGTIG